MSKSITKSESETPEVTVGGVIAGTLFCVGVGVGTAWLVDQVLSDNSTERRLKVADARIKQLETSQSNLRRINSAQSFCGVLDEFEINRLKARNAELSKELEKLRKA